MTRVHLNSYSAMTNNQMSGLSSHPSQCILIENSSSNLGKNRSLEVQIWNENSMIVVSVDVDRVKNSAV